MTGFVFWHEEPVVMPAHLESSSLSSRAHCEGPEGKIGNALAFEKGPLEYDAGRMEWRKYPGHESLWFGVDEEAPMPGPEACARKEQHAGHLVTLGDGREWLAPVARIWNGAPGLPKRRTLGADGARGWAVLPEFREATEIAERVYGWAYSSENLGAEEQDEMVGTLLCLNYRLGFVEACAMGLLTDEAMRDVLLASIDFPTIQRIAAELKEGKEAAG